MDILCEEVNGHHFFPQNKVTGSFPLNKGGQIHSMRVAPGALVNYSLCCK